MKINEVVRNVPANIHDIHLALVGLPNNMKVKAHSETGVSWPASLMVMTPRKLKPKSVVKISTIT
jgi:hypothetical protein